MKKRDPGQDARTTGEKLREKCGGTVRRTGKTPEVKGKQYIGLYQEIRQEHGKQPGGRKEPETEIKKRKWKRFRMRAEKTLSAAGEVPVLDKNI